MVEWNRILQEEGYSLEEPDESVVSFFTFLKTKSKKGRVLDLGCGGGRHLIYMANQGFEAYGIDISETGLNLSKERLRRQGLEGYILKCDMSQLPYVDSCFDVAVCLYTIYHQKLKRIQETISEIHRVLRKGSFLLLNFHSKKSSKYGKGEKVEEGTFIQQNGPEKGVIHHFTDKEEIMELLKSFKTVNVELREQKSVDGYLQSRLIVIASV